MGNDFHDDRTGEGRAVRPAWFPEDAARPYPSPDGAPMTLADFAGQRRRPEPPRYRRPMIEENHYSELQEAYAGPKRRRSSSASRHRRDMIMAASIILGTAGIIGAIAVERSAGGPISSPLLASLDRPAATPSKGGEVTISKKTVPTVSLAVKDVEAEPGSLVALSLKSVPAVADHGVDLRITGIPREAYLTAGTKLPDATWLLRPGEEQNVKLMWPKDLSGPATLTVAAIEPATGELAAPLQEFSVKPVPPDALVLPTAAAPESQIPATGKTGVLDYLLEDTKKDIRIVAEKSPPPRNAEILDLLSNGQSLLDAGEMTGARSFFERALALGAPEAALKLGESYDPAIFAERKVHGLQPDPAEARRFYEMAKASGVKDADARLEALTQE